MIQLGVLIFRTTENAQFSIDCELNGFPLHFHEVIHETIRSNIRILLYELTINNCSTETPSMEQIVVLTSVKILTYEKPIENPKSYDHSRAARTLGGADEHPLQKM